jgi:hypothetical protein
MATTTPLASVPAGLLARKGQARPAMRAQTLGGNADPTGFGDQLGWNDSGAPSTAETLPPVLRERATLANEIEGRAAALSFDTVKRLQRETAREGRAAFTLRLDQERHLRLRLAATMHGRSAQQLVTAALDAFLTNMPDVEALVAQLPPRPNR